MKPFLLIITVWLLVSCDKNDGANTLDGRYIGFFTRDGGDTSQVSLIFQGNSFQGTSSIDQYPAICEGSFEQSKNSISFNPACSFTANFDWSLLLKEKYNMQIHDEGTIRIWRIVNGVQEELLMTKIKPEITQINYLE